jgi:hypothetical protein
MIIQMTLIASVVTFFKISKRETLLSNNYNVAEVLGNDMTETIWQEVKGTARAAQ